MPQAGFRKLGLLFAYSFRQIQGYTFLQVSTKADRVLREPFFDESDPLVVGVDIARGGADSNVIYFRRGGDGKSIPPIKIPGAETRDSMRMVSKLAEVLSGACSSGEKPAVMFVDGTGIGGP